MDYTILDKLKTGEYGQEPGESEQAFMERKLQTMFRRTEDDKTGDVNGRMAPTPVACDAAAQTVCMEFSPDDWMKNIFGFLHGGLIATAMDITMGILARWCRLRENVMTAQMSVSYLRPVPADRPYRVSARVTKAGRRALFVDAELTVVGEEKPAATASAVYM